MTRRAALAALAALCLAGAAWAAPAEWTRFEMRGTIASLARATRLLTLARDDRAEPVPVQVLPGAVVQVDGAIRPDLGPLAPGDRVGVWGAEGPGRHPVAVRVVSRPRPPRAAAPERGAIRGVVLAARGWVLGVAAEDGAVRQVVMSAATRLSGGDSVGRFDVIRATGVENSDGSIVALAVAVEFDASRAGRVRGAVVSPTPGVGFFVEPAVFVNVLPDTAVVRGAERRPYTAIPPGRVVTALGQPIVYQRTLLGLTARVVLIE